MEGVPPALPASQLGYSLPIQAGAGGDPSNSEASAAQSDSPGVGGGDQTTAPGPTPIEYLE